MNISSLTTEQRNPKSYEIDTKTTAEILTIINSEDITVPHCITPTIPVIANLVEDVVSSFKQGGRLFFTSEQELREGWEFLMRQSVLQRLECQQQWSRELLLEDNVL